MADIFEAARDQPTEPAKDKDTQPIIIRKLDRLETTRQNIANA